MFSRTLQKAFINRQKDNLTNSAVQFRLNQHPVGGVAQHLQLIPHEMALLPLLDQAQRKKQMLKLKPPLGVWPLWNQDVATPLLGVLVQWQKKHYSLPNVNVVSIQSLVLSEAEVITVKLLLLPVYGKKPVQNNFRPLQTYRQLSELHEKKLCLKKTKHAL